MRIKHAYNTLLNSKTRKRYDSRSDTSSYSYYSGAEQNRGAADEEDFYSFGKTSLLIVIFAPDLFLRFVSMCDCLCRDKLKLVLQIVLGKASW